MKKLSISLFAVLAIVFAVASAFSTQKVKSTFLTDEWYVVDGGSFTQSEFEGSDTDPITILSNYINAGSGEATEFTSDDVEPGLDGDHECNSGQKVCAVRFPNANTGSTLSATELDNYLDVNSYVAASIYFKQ